MLYEVITTYTLSATGKDSSGNSVAITTEVDNQVTTLVASHDTVHQLAETIFEFIENTSYNFV